MDRRAKAANEMLPKRLSFAHSSQRIKTAFSMQVLLSTVLEAESGEELRDVIAAFGDGEELLTMYSTSAKGAAKSLRTTTAAAKRHFGDRGVRAKAQASAAETASVRQARAKAMAQVKLDEQIAPPVYTLDDDKQLPEAPKVDSLHSPTFNSAVPQLLVNIDGMQEWSMSPKVQLALADFGGMFKKSASYKETGLHHDPINQKEQKEIIDFVTKVTEPLQFKLEKAADDSDQTPEVPLVVKNVLSSMWLVGQDSKRRFAGAVRNGFGQLRVQCGCQVRLLVFSISKLNFLGELKLSEYVQTVESVTDLTVHEIVEHQASNQEHNQIIFSFLFLINNRSANFTTNTQRTNTKIARLRTR